MKETEIIIKVRLDSNNIPEEIYWSAPDGGIKDEQSKAILLSFWDSVKKETLKMDLWNDNRTDEEQIGATYDELEKAMIQESKSDMNLSQREIEVMSIYKSFNSSNKHKMDPIPVCKIPEDYI